MPPANRQKDCIARFEYNAFLRDVGEVWIGLEVWVFGVDGCVHTSGVIQEFEIEWREEPKAFSTIDLNEEDIAGVVMVWCYGAGRTQPECGTTLPTIGYKHRLIIDHVFEYWGKERILYVSVIGDHVRIIAGAIGLNNVDKFSHAALASMSLVLHVIVGILISTIGDLDGHMTVFALEEFGGPF